MYNFLSNLKQAEPFIYKINNTYYYLGCTICRACDSNEIDTYLNLLKEFAFLKGCTYPLGKMDYKKFHKYFDQVVSISTPEISDSQLEQTAAKTADILRYVIPEEVAELSKQMEIRQEMYDYRNERPNRPQFK